MPEFERSRLIEAEWQEPDNPETGEKYVAEIIIYANNRNGLIADISKCLTEKNISIMALSTRMSKQGLATLQTTIEISGRDELNKIIDRLHKIESVLDVERTSG